jgi:predicted metal-dependent hydrolase
MDFPPVEINDLSFGVKVIATHNRNAYARVRDGSIIISLPSRMNSASAFKVASGLYARIKSDIIKKPERYAYSNLKEEVAFTNNQQLSILGHELTVRILPSYAQMARGKLRDGVITIAVPDQLEGTEQQRIVSSIARRVISKALKDDIAARVESINKQYFNIKISKVKLSNASTRWGSCSSRRGQDARIMLNFKLLFLPEECLDYVIVHELAHTRVHNHNEKFWGIVEAILPDYKARKKLLKESAYKLKLSGMAQDQVKVS